MISVESAGATDVGKKRKGNEDTFSIDRDLNLYIVADGMGGHQAGEVASDLVVRTLQDYVEKYRESGGFEKLAEYDNTLSVEANCVNSGVHLANRVVYQLSNSKETYRGMGATVSAVFFTGDTMIVANVGDSPIYLIRKGYVETLSVPHTVIAEQMAINPDAVAQLGRNYRHMLTRAMGIESQVKVDICELPCFKDDMVVIASDGLTDKVSPEEIMDIVKEKRPERACKELVDLANNRGGDDNITVIVMKVKSVKREKSGGIFGWISRFFQKKTQ